MLCQFVFLILRASKIFPAYHSVASDLVQYPTVVFSWTKSTILEKLTHETLECQKLWKCWVLGEMTYNILLAKHRFGNIWCYTKDPMTLLNHIWKLVVFNTLSLVTSCLRWRSTIHYNIWGDSDTIKSWARKKNNKFIFSFLSWQVTQSVTNFLYSCSPSLDLYGKKKTIFKNCIHEFTKSNSRYPTKKALYIFPIGSTGA